MTYTLPTKKLPKKIERYQEERKSILHRKKDVRKWGVGGSKEILGNHKLI